MSFDGIMLAAVTAELAPALLNARIDKIFQPASDTVIFHTRQQRVTRRLLISAHASQARVHFTDQSPANPSSPPMFCMLLRKHLEGGRITGVDQPGLDRQLSVHVEAIDELGRRCERVLICEIMGKYSNILLLDPVTGNILDGIRRYSHAVSRHREVLPGRPYVPAPAQDKTDTLTATEEVFRQRFLDGSLHRQLNRVVAEGFSGFGPLTAREVVARAGLPPGTVVDECGDYELSRLWQAFAELAAVVREQRFSPTVVRENGLCIAFTAIDPIQYTGLERQHLISASQTVDTFYAEQQARERLARQRQVLESVVARELKRCRKKMAAQQQDVDTAANSEDLRLAGELVTANIYVLTKGMTTAELANFYDPDGGTVTIGLEKELTPAQNAQRYFRRYNKAKNTARQAGEHLAKTQEEIDYLESVLYAISLAADVPQLDPIRAELVAAGYVKPAPEPRGKNGKKNSGQQPAGQQQASGPMRFVSRDGLTILVGKNNVQNDYLTLRLAQDDDLWLHTKDIPGSHVLIRRDNRPEIPDGTIREAAVLAAHFSKAQQSSKVPVDYTAARHVRKPKGLPAGKVIYDHQQTIFVTPGEEITGLLAQTLEGD